MRDSCLAQIIIFIGQRVLRTKITKLCFPFNFTVRKCTYILNSDFHIYIHKQGDSRLEDITAGDDFLGLCDQKSLYKHVSDFGRLRSYDRLKLGIEGNDY